MKKYMIALSIMLSGLGLGLFIVNLNSKKSCNLHVKRGTFAIDRKFTGQVLTKDEAAMYKRFISDNEIFVSSLSSSDKIVFNSIAEKVRRIVNLNPNTRISYREILNKSEMNLIKKVRKYRKKRKIVANSNDRKVFKSMSKKLTLDQQMELWQYIKK